MVSDLLFDELLWLGLLWLCVILHGVWPYNRAGCPLPPKPTTPPQKRSKDSKPVPGLIHKPSCAACEHAAEHAMQTFLTLPPLMVSSHGRPRAVETAPHFCPNANCRYDGRVGLGNLRANGHPSGKPWRQWQCVVCRAYVLETHGTIFYGKTLPAKLIVCVIAARAEGLGIRAVARVFEMDPNTVLQWVAEAAAHSAAFSRDWLHDVQVHQVQLDELCAWVSEIKDNQGSDTETGARLKRSPSWVWVALDPVSTLLLALHIGDRTLAMAQGLVHQVVQVGRRAVCRCLSPMASRTTPERC